MNGLGATLCEALLYRPVVLYTYRFMSFLYYLKAMCSCRVPCTVEPPFVFNPLSENDKFIMDIVRSAVNINKAPSSLSHILYGTNYDQKERIPILNC